MHTLLIQLRYKPARAKQLLKLSNSKVKREVKKLFGALKVPNLFLLGEIDLRELGDRLVSVRCRSKRTSLLYQDFERLKGALSDEGFAKIRAKKGIASIDIDERKCPEPPSSHPEPSIALTDQTSSGSGHRHHDAMDGMQDGVKGPSDDSEMAVALPLSAPRSPLYVPTTLYQPTTPEVEAMVLARTTSVETVTSPPHFPLSPSPSFSLSSPVYASSSVYQTTPRAGSSDAVVSHWMSELDNHDASKGLPPILSKRPSSVEVHNSGRSTEEPYPAIIPPNDAPSSFGQSRHPSSLVSSADLSRLTIKKPRYENIPADEGDSGKAERSVPGRRRARSLPNDQSKQWKLTSPRSGSKFELRHGQVQDSDLSSSSSLSPSPSRSTSSLQCDQEAAPLVMTSNADPLTRILDAYNRAKGQLHIANQEMAELEKVIFSAIEQRTTN